jgi:hypothetical protein
MPSAPGSVVRKVVELARAVGVQVPDPSRDLRDSLGPR